MVNSQQFVFCTMLIIGISASCEAKDWRGITPLHSTRKDVVRILGPSPNRDRVRSNYRLANEDVLIIFSGDKLCDPKTTRVPLGTVLLVQVTPRSKPRFNQLQIDRTRLREFSPSEDPDWKGFIDVQEGFMVRNYKDLVDEIYYIAAAKDQALCPSYYANPENLARIYIDFNSGAFDEYSNLTFVNEKARLDNFAIYLQQDQPTWKGYIVLYHSGDAVSDAQSRGERVKQYLISLGLSETRFSIIIGGPRSKPTTKLYALPATSSPPTP